MPSLASRLALYLVADPDQTDRDLLPIVRQALEGGCTAVQLRAKRLPDGAFLTLAREMREASEESGALFLVNDRLDIALATGADGVHLGVDDLPLTAARQLATRAQKSDFVIGYSPETDVQVTTAAAAGADYLGIGPVFGTTSKPDAGDAIGLDHFRRRVAAAGIPVIGIGGIQPSNARSVIETGAVGIAVVGAILRAKDPCSAAAALRDAVTSGSGAHR